MNQQEMNQLGLYDVAVIGGGPAGATAADDLAQKGYSVLLLDRAGRIKPCGGAIPPRAMKDFHIPDSMLVAHATKARMISPTNHKVDIPIDNGLKVTDSVDNMRAAIKYLEKSKPGDTAIFYRTNAQSRVFEEVFMRIGIPYKVVGGVRFYERKEIKDLLAYLRVVVNPEDEISMRRIINTPKRGIGDRALDQIDLYSKKNGLTFWQSLCEVDKNQEITAKSSASLIEFVKFVKSMQTLVEAKTRPSVITQAVLEQSGLLAELEESKDPQDEVRVENLEELVAVATEYEEGEVEEGEEISLTGFLEDVSLVADADQIPDGDDHGGVVTMMTLHTAKGLEFPTVFLTGMEEGIFPHSRTLDDPEELQEERRLAYVGLTRARENLFITRAEYRSAWGAPNYNAASRFISEIPDNVIEWNQAEEKSFKLKSSVRRNFTAPKATGKISNTMQLAVGERVSHDTFGLGTVIEVSGEGDRAEATIDFGSFGPKRLLLRYAPVEKL
ncbi:MAG: helicase / ATP-dependent helicase PcrA [Actinomycetota bacterium]